MVALNDHITQQNDALWKVRKYKHFIFLSGSHADEGAALAQLGSTTGERGS